MDLNKLKISNTNFVNINNSFNMPLLKLNIKLLEDNMESSKLEVYVDSNLDSTPKRKIYAFDFQTPLRVVDNLSDEFIIDSTYGENGIQLESYVVRKSRNGELLETPIKQLVNGTPIILFEGLNRISTNCKNVQIEVDYQEKANIISKASINPIVEQQSNEILSLDDIYFKDCFTETEKGINAEFNKLTINCMNSLNGNFTLDCDGNLVVNSITTKVNNNQSKDLDFDAIYPVGSIYLSVNDVDPGSLFTGVWEKITGYYLYAGLGGQVSGNNTTSGPSVDSTSSTAITVAQMPSHTHIQDPHCHAQNPNTWMNVAPYDGLVPTGGTYAAYAGTSYNTEYATASNQYTGGNQGHTHTLNNHTHYVEPLRMELYCYKRVA